MKSDIEMYVLLTDPGERLDQTLSYITFLY